METYITVDTFPPHTMVMNDSPEKTVSRRNFLTTAAKAGMLVVLNPFLIPCVNKCYASSAPFPDLAVVTGDPEKAVGKALDLLGGISRFVKKGQRVVIKPNMSFAKGPEEGANTNPLVVAAVAKMCNEAGAKDILIVDHTLHQGDLCIELSGIGPACRTIARAQVLALNDEKFYQKIPVPQGKTIKEVHILKEVLICDVLINLPTAKSHSATGVSLGMKGLMGVIWDRGIFHSRVDLHQAIADLNTVVKPTLTIIDASRVLLTGGPSGPGTVEKRNTIIAGIDPVAIDSYGVTLAPWFNRPFHPSHIKHLVAAHQMGLGAINLQQVKIKEERV